MMAAPRSTNSAFTLTECVVVMVTIIVLASIVVAGLLGRGQGEPKLDAGSKQVQAEAPVSSEPLASVAAPAEEEGSERVETVAAAFVEDDVHPDGEELISLRTEIGLLPTTD